jgi:hypothetical protein
MAKQIARLLKTNVMADIDLKAIAQLLQKSGRNGDSILAHITPKEAKKLEREGGAGSVNPETGLLEYYDEYGADSYMAGASYQAPSYQAAPDYTPVATPSYQSTEYTGGGYVPEGYTPSYTAGQPDYSGSNQAQISTPAPVFSSENVASPINFGQPQAAYGVNFGAPAGGPGVQLPATAQPTLGAVAGQQYPNLEPSSAPQEKSILDRVKSATGLSEESLRKLGMAGVTGLTGLITGNKARKQGQQAAQNIQAIANPYQQQGKQLLEQAQSGTLTAANQQALQAAQARLAQDAQSRGGVGAQQMATQIENLRQQLLAGQYDLGLKVSSIGDNIALGAIKTGLQADQYVNAANQEFYTQMAQILGGQPITQRPAPTVG